MRRVARTLINSTKASLSKFYKTYKNEAYLQYIKFYKIYLKRKDIFIRFELHSTYSAICKDLFWFKSRLSYYLHNWIYTTNHKRIAINYFIFVIFSGITGLVLATIIRLELAYPGVGVLAGDSIQYLTIITLHGIVMVFFMIMPLLLGAFGNFLLPTQLGVHDVAFPRLNSASFWFLPSGLIMLCQLLCTDRRYHRLNCFNFREVQSLLKKKYFFSLMMSNESHELHDQTLAALRLRAQNASSLTSAKKINSDFGLNLTTKKRLFYFDSFYSYRFTATFNNEPFVSIHNPTLYSHFGKIRRFVNQEFSSVLDYFNSFIDLETITFVFEALCSFDNLRIFFFYSQGLNLKNYSFYELRDVFYLYILELIDFILYDTNVSCYHFLVDIQKRILRFNFTNFIIIFQNYLCAFLTTYHNILSNDWRILSVLYGKLCVDGDTTVIWSFYHTFVDALNGVRYWNSVSALIRLIKTIDEAIDESVNSAFFSLFERVTQTRKVHKILIFLCEPGLSPSLRVLMSIVVYRESLLFDIISTYIGGTGISYYLRSYVDIAEKFWDFMFFYVVVLHFYDMKLVSDIFFIQYTTFFDAIFYPFEFIFCILKKNGYNYFLEVFVHLYYITLLLAVLLENFVYHICDVSLVILEQFRTTHYQSLFFAYSFNYLKESIISDFIFLLASNYYLLAVNNNFTFYSAFCEQLLRLCDYPATAAEILSIYYSEERLLNPNNQISSISFDLYTRVCLNDESFFSSILICVDSSVDEGISFLFQMLKQSFGYIDNNYEIYYLLTDPYLLAALLGTISWTDILDLIGLLDAFIKHFIDNVHTLAYVFITEIIECFVYLLHESYCTKLGWRMTVEASLITSIRNILETIEFSVTETNFCCFLNTNVLLLDAYYMSRMLLSIFTGLANTDFIWNMDSLLFKFDYRAFQDLCLQRDYYFMLNIFYFIDNLPLIIYNTFFRAIKMSLVNAKYYKSPATIYDDICNGNFDTYFNAINDACFIIIKLDSLLIFYWIVKNTFAGTGRAHVLASNDFLYDARFKEQALMKSSWTRNIYYYCRVQIDPIIPSTSFLLQNLMLHEVMAKVSFWITRIVYRFYVYAHHNAIVSVPEIMQAVVSNTALFVDETVSQNFTEGFNDARYHKSDKPRFKYDDKTGNIFPELKQHLITQLIPSFTLITRGAARPFWIFSSEFAEKFTKFYATIDKTIYKDFLAHAFSRLNSKRYTHERYYDQTHFGLNFWDLHFVSLNALRADNFAVNTKWLGPIEIVRKFHTLFIEQAFQYRMLSNWRHLKFHREAWRCRSLLGRNQKSSFRRNLHENAVFWVLERNSRDILPGWAFVTPFSSRTRYTAVGKVDVALMAVFLAGLGSLISSANFLLTYRYLSTLSNKKMRDARSFYSEALMVSSGMILGANPLLLIAILLLLSDRHWKTSFFDYSGGGDTVLFQHMFWFFGHPEVYIIIMPCFGFTNTILSYYLRKRISARASLVYSMYTISFLGFFVWGHHMYMVGLSHQTRMLYSTLTVMISVPAATKIMHWLVTIVNSTIHFELPLLFTFTFIFLFVSGGISGMFVAHTGMDILFHDTFYVIGHFHIMFSGAAMFSAFSAFYFYFPALFGVKYSRIFAYMHFIYYLIGQLMTLVPMFWLGYAGMPRRVLDYPTAFGGWHSISSAGHLVTVAAIMAFFFMLIDSIRQSKPAIRTTFGVGRYNTRLNFYYYEIHRLAYLRTKTGLLSRRNVNRSLQWKGTTYANYEYLETTVFSYQLEKLDVKDITVHVDEQKVCDMLDSSVYLQILFLINIVLYITALSVLIAWILAGFYLLIVGILLLLCDADVLVGFLWLIDLGVGLVLLVFIVFLNPFNTSTQNLNFSLARLTFFPFLLFLLFFIIISFACNYGILLSTFLNFWFLYVSWYDYYAIHSLRSATDLLVLRDIYFYSTSFEFILLNFLLFYSVILCVLITLGIRRFSFILNSTENYYNKSQVACKAAYFFRVQSMVAQRSTSSGSRVWNKKKD